VYLVILAISMLAYRTNRSSKVKRLHADLAKISADQDKLRATEAEANRLTKLIPANAGIPAYIEALYLSARESGLKQCVVSTEVNKSSGSARPGSSESTTITKHRLKVAADGTYRNFAEFVRKVQNSERLIRITDLKLIPNEAQLKGALTIELYSIPVQR
jgi:Tfp pilus assembly protein PilO